MKTLILKRNENKFSKGIVGCTKEEYKSILDGAVDKVKVLDGKGKKVCEVSKDFFGKFVSSNLGTEIAIDYSKAVEAEQVYKKNVKAKIEAKKGK